MRRLRPFEGARPSLARDGSDTALTHRVVEEVTVEVEDLGSGLEAPLHLSEKLRVHFSTRDNLRLRCLLVLIKDVQISGEISGVIASESCWSIVTTEASSADHDVHRVSDHGLTVNRWHETGLASLELLLKQSRCGRGAALRHLDRSALDTQAAVIYEDRWCLLVHLPPRGCLQSRLFGSELRRDSCRDQFDVVRVPGRLQELLGAPETVHLIVNVV